MSKFVTCIEWATLRCTNCVRTHIQSKCPCCHPCNAHPKASNTSSHSYSMHWLRKPIPTSDRITTGSGITSVRILLSHRFLNLGKSWRHTFVKNTILWFSKLSIPLKTLQPCLDSLSGFISLFETVQRSASFWLGSSYTNTIRIHKYRLAQYHRKAGWIQKDVDSENCFQFCKWVWEPDCSIEWIGDPSSKIKYSE